MSSASEKRQSRSSMDDDGAFSVSKPINNSPALSTEVAGSNTTDPTFIQNQLALQRNLSISQSQTSSSISRQLSTKSNTSYDAGLSQSGIISVLAYADTQKNHTRGESTDSITDDVKACSLKKSNSRSTMESNASVNSVHALGALPLGSLRPHHVNLEQGQKSPSHDCLASGDVVIVSGVPTGALFGFDSISFSVGANGHFEGIRDIPSGPHFIYGSSSAMSTRNGFWIMSERRATGDRGEIFVKHWDTYNETLEDEVSTAEVRIQKENVPKVFKSLMPYSNKADSATISDSLTKAFGTEEQIIWQRLTFAIKGAMLSSITGNRWNKWQISSTNERKPTEWKPSDARTNKVLDAASDRSELMSGKDMVLTFAFPQTGNTFSSDVVGRARTEQATDTSAHIMAVIDDRCMEDEDWVVGELQFCYITGMTLGNMTCLEQWAHLVRVVFKAFRLSLDRPILFRKIIETVHAQLIYDDDGFEGSIFDHDEGLQDGLKILLTIFKSRLNEQLLAKGSGLTDDQEAVGKAFEAFESWLWKWDWDLRGNYLRSGKIQLEDGEYVDAELAELQAEDERGEFAPVMVELEEDGREKGLLSW
jgi:A1 cistron-splicing factor AAR2